MLKNLTVELDDADQPFDVRAGNRVKFLCRLFQVRQVDLADELGIPTATFARRLAGLSPWRASELSAIGRLFGRGLDVEGLPRLDSNQQPVGYRLAA